MDPCRNNLDSGTCSAWAPEDEIELFNGTYIMFHSWLASVVDDPAPLWTCDDAYFEPRRTTKFTVKNANAGEMLYELGLRNNDIPQTLNGYALDDWQSAIAAFHGLYMDGESSYTLTVKRGSSTITLSYELLFTLGP